MLIKFWCTSLKKSRCSSKCVISLTQRYRTKMHGILLNKNKFKPILLKFKIFNSNSNSKIMLNFCTSRGNTSTVGWGGETPTWENFTTVIILKKNTSKYAKLMVESHVCDKLNRIYRFSSFLTKKCLKNVLENCVESNRLISLVHLWHYFAFIKIVCSFF